jgi:hypothetical protein
MSETLGFRRFGPGLEPRRTEIALPGWAGEPQPRADGSRQQPWHCTPFSESAKYGFELCYPFEFEMTVSTRAGKLIIEAEFGPDPQNGLSWPPIKNLGETFYTFNIHLDLKAPPGMAIRTEPHPRFFTDLTGTVPIAVPGLVRSNWWPLVLFLVFKAPPEGGRHLFRLGEPVAQIVVVPEEHQIEAAEMDAEQAAERELQARRILASRDRLAESSTWTSITGTEFDGVYRHMLRAARARDQV